MKKILILIFFGILSMAQAAQTYSVTINLVPKIASDAIFLSNLNGNLSSGFSCGERLTSTLTCQLPSGSYKLSVYGYDNVENFFPDVQRYITVDRDITIQQKVMPGFKEIPSLPADIIKAFDKLRMNANAKAVNCPSGEKLRLCAISQLSVNELQKILSSSQELKQTKAWSPDSFTSTSFAAFETISEDSYLISLIKYGGLSVLIHLYIW